MVTREELVNLARDIEKKKRDIEIMDMFCTTTWTDEQRVDFRAEYRVKQDELFRLEQKYDNAEKNMLTIDTDNHLNVEV